MLDERKIKLLKDHMLCDETLAQIEDYNPDTKVVTFKDGSEHQLVECWTRVMGYLRTVSDFNTGKQSEFNERKWFSEDKIGGCPCERKEVEP